MEKIKIEVEAKTGRGVWEYVDDSRVLRTDKHILYETVYEEDNNVGTTKVMKVAEVTPKILMGEFPVAVKIVLEGEKHGIQKILMLNLQDLLDKYNEEYDNAKAQTVSY